MPHRLIAMEGIDGAGKGTQTKLLRDRLENAGQRTTVLSFPRYEQTRFGRDIGDYLNGRFGDLKSVDPFLAALLFAGDRFESKPVLMEALGECDVVICDRYVASNIAHQGARAAADRQIELIERIEALEYGLYALPRPDVTILLDAPVPLAQSLIAKKAARTYTTARADMHEADADYLEAVRGVYRQLSVQSPNWHSVDIAGSDGARSVEEIADDIWRVVS